MTASVVRSPVFHPVFMGFLALSSLEGVFTCRLGTPEECANCSFVPGYKLAGMGYDVVTLRQKRASVFDVNSYLANSCMVCVNPLMGGELQKLPLHMKDWRAESDCKRKTLSSYYYSVSSLVDDIAFFIANDWKAGLKLENVDLQLAGSKSKVSGFASAHSNADKSSFSFQQFTCSVYSFSVPSKPPLSLDFQRRVASLPHHYTSNSEAYKDIIDTYGTHYISDGDLGGMMKRVTSIRTCLAALNKVFVSDVETCLSMGLDLDIPVGLPVDLGLNLLGGQCSKVATNSDSATGYSMGFLSHHTEVNGGRTLNGVASMRKANIDSFLKWMKSLNEFPEMVSFSLQPLYQLVDDKQTSADLQTAISQYVIDSGIKRIKTENQACRDSPDLSADCCPLLAGRGRLTVFVDRGFSLRGDGMAEPEVYVKLWCSGQHRLTRWITTYDPLWHTHFNFNYVNTQSSLELQVWDKSPGERDDDLQGGCSVNLEQGSHVHSCGLSNGSFTFSYTLTCDKHLTGDKCDQYYPSPN
ncbi:perforin-1-like [Oncorhynchus clarkii lewisi]|uniref:perforin-1-like n=1 Tax=Oncorhynchus clarkii lewisi TaxID=490388 RepID=UPI0039B94012